jgi:hypothetical protein
MVRSIWRDRQVGGSSLVCASLSLPKDALIVTPSVYAFHQEVVSW